MTYFVVENMELINRNNKVKQRGNSPPITISSNPGMPLRLRTKLRFVKTYISAVTGLLQSTLFGCNTPVQPSRTVGTTDKPLYWTKLVSTYDKCYTVGSSIKVTFCNVTTADGVVVVLSTDNNSVSSTSLDELRERVDSKSGVLGYYTGGTTTWSATHHWEPKPYLGVAANSTNNISGSLTDPPDPYFWVLSLATTGGGTGNVAVTVEIEYDLVFFDLATPL